MMAEAAIGRRMLSEIEETSLDEILTALRTSLISTSLNPASTTTTTTGNNALAPAPPSKPKSYPIPVLDALVTRHSRATQSAPLSVSGRHLPLIYLLVATLIAAPHSKAVVVVDVDGRFDVTRVLQCAPFQPEARPASGGTATAESPGLDTSVQQQSTTTVPPDRGNEAIRDTVTQVTPVTQVTQQDLKHIHVYRPARGSPSYIRDVLASVEHHMIYTRHASIAREWWGTVVIGGGSPAILGLGNADVTTGWKSWLRVDREEVRGFGVGMSVEEALLERDRRQRVVDESSWTASCVWGGFTFTEGQGGSARPASSGSGGAK